AHHSQMARIRYGLADCSDMGLGYYNASAAPAAYWVSAQRVPRRPRKLLPHPSFGRGKGLDERRPREEAFRVLHQRRRRLGQQDAVVVEPPQQRGDRDVEHRELLAQHVLVLGEHRRDLHQAVAYKAARLVELFLIVAFQRIDVREELFLEAMQEKP